MTHDMAHAEASVDFMSPRMGEAATGLLDMGRGIAVRGRRSKSVAPGQGRAGASRTCVVRTCNLLVDLTEAADGLSVGVA